MEFKPRIFIGSSSEGYDVALKIAEGLDEIAETNLWKNAFELGKGNYENLISQVALYDYAVLVATGDDVTISRKKKNASTRDNVLFEFGLFAGGLGREKALYVIEKDIRIPSDLLGVSLPEFSPRNDPGFERSIQDCIQVLKKYIKNNELTYSLGFLPSTALAYGYFINFVEKTVERLMEDKNEVKLFHIEGSQDFTIAEIKFTVLIPDDLSDDMFKKVKAKRLKDGWKKLKVDPKDVRDYDFSVDVSQVAQGLLHLVDIPFTLNALNKAVEMYSKKGHIGKDEKEALLEYREIRNFYRTLDYLIGNSSIAKGIVSLEIVDI